MIPLLLAIAACGDASLEAEREGRAGSESVQRLYSCGGDNTFTVEDVEAKRTPPEGVLDSVVELRRTMDGAFLPQHGWIEVFAEERTVTILAPHGSAFASATFERRYGSWDALGWGDCVPRLRVAGRSILRWAFAHDSYPPEPDARELEVLVQEIECSSGRDINGLIESSVAYGEESISVVLSAPVPPGSYHTCPGNAPVLYTVALEEPAGGREIVDPSVYPVVEPTPGALHP